MKIRPSKTKYKKEFKKLKTLFTKKNTLNKFLGKYAIIAKNSARLTHQQIETGRRILSKNLKKKNSKIWVKLFTNIPITKKSVGVRMGKGKASIDQFIILIKPGHTLYEIETSKLTYSQIKIIYIKLKHKLSINIRLLFLGLIV